MSRFRVEADNVLKSSEELVRISSSVKNVQNKINSVNISDILNGSYRPTIEQRIKTIMDAVGDEAVKMDSLGKALEVIVNEYKKTDSTIAGNTESLNVLHEEAVKSSNKKPYDEPWYKKFINWVTGNEPDKYTQTSSSQEKAADKAMQKAMKKVLKDEKYSKKYWKNASIEERKQILQDYMNEVMKIYGLNDVDPVIRWDDSLTYTNSQITWGYYSDGDLAITLNEAALSDSNGIWSSYDLLGTVGHELRHAYQFEAMKNPDKFVVSKETLDKWEQAYANYAKDAENYSTYRKNALEVDARKFEVKRGWF